MAATLARKTISKDARGFYTTEEVYESFDPITPSSTAKTASQTHEDGKYQLIQTFTDETTNPDPGGGKVFPDTWSVEVSTAAEPIESHPKFSTITNAQWSNYRFWKNGQTSQLPSTTWTPRTNMGDLGATLEDAITRNITTYFVPKIVIKHTLVSEAKPSLELIGKLNFPSFAQDMTPAGVNFIITGCSAVREGTYYKISYEWLGSGLGGWSPFLYSTNN